MVVARGDDLRASAGKRHVAHGGGRIDSQQRLAIFGLEATDRTIGRSRYSVRNVQW